MKRSTHQPSGLCVRVAIGGIINIKHLKHLNFKVRWLSLLYDTQANVDCIIAWNRIWRLALHKTVECMMIIMNASESAEWFDRSIIVVNTYTFGLYDLIFKYCQPFQLSSCDDIHYIAFATSLCNIYIYMNTTSVGLFYWFSCLSSILNDFVTTIYIFKLKRLMNYWDKLAEYITLRHNDGLVLVLSILMYWLTYARHGCKWPHNFFYCYSVLAVAQQKIVPAAAMIHICT